MFLPGNTSKILDRINPVDVSHPLNKGVVRRYDFRLADLPLGGGGSGNGLRNIAGNYYRWHEFQGHNKNAMGADPYLYTTTQDPRPGGGASLYRNKLASSNANAYGADGGPFYNLCNIYNFTIAFWFKIINVNNLGGMFQLCHTDNFGVSFFNGTFTNTVFKPQLFVNNYSSTYPGGSKQQIWNSAENIPLPMKDWVHICVTSRNTPEGHMYLNGKEVSLVSPGVINSGAYPIFGLPHYRPGNTCTWYLDDFRYWSGVILDADQAKLLYETSKQEFDPTLNWIEVGMPLSQQWVAPVNRVAAAKALVLSVI